MSYPIDEEQILITKLQHKVGYWYLLAFVGAIIGFVMVVAVVISSLLGHDTMLLTAGTVAVYIASLIALSTARDYRKDIDDITGANEL